MAITSPQAPLAENSLPDGVGQYPEWLYKKFQYDTKTGRAEYDAVASLLHTHFSKSLFWIELCKNIDALNQNFFIDTGYDLFSSTAIPELLFKSYESFLNKTYRYNFVKQKRQYRGTDEWLKPSGWYEEINDIVRTCFVVKYLDGVERLIDNLSQLCNSHNIKNQYTYKANDDGYYAAHFYCLMNVNTPIKTDPIQMWVEIQVTTQLQEVLKRCIHIEYKKIRDLNIESEVPWQWRYRENEFFTNSLGHVLHNIEGMIMEVRRRQEKEKNNA